MCLSLHNNHVEIIGSPLLSVYKILRVDWKGAITSPLKVDYVWNTDHFFDNTIMPKIYFASPGQNMLDTTLQVKLINGVVRVDGGVMHFYTKDPWELSSTYLLKANHIVAVMKPKGTTIVDTRINEAVAPGLEWDGTIVSMGPTALQYMKEKHPEYFKRGWKWVDKKNGKYLFNVKTGCLGTL